MAEDNEDDGDDEHGEDDGRRTEISEAEDEDEEDAGDTDEDQTEDEERFDENDRSLIDNRSTYSSATSVSTSGNPPGQSCYPCQGYPPHPPPVDTRSGQQMTTN